MLHVKRLESKLDAEKTGLTITSVPLSSEFPCILISLRILFYSHQHENRSDIPCDFSLYGARRLGRKEFIMLNCRLYQSASEREVRKRAFVGVTLRCVCACELVCDILFHQFLIRYHHLLQQKTEICPLVFVLLRQDWANDDVTVTHKPTDCVCTRVCVRIRACVHG